MPLVTSRHNPIVARYRAAARGEAPDVMLLDGVHLVAEALAAGIQLDDVAIASGAEARADVAQLVETLTRARIPFVTASAPVMTALSPVRSSSPIVAIAARPAAAPSRLYAPPSPLVTIAADVQDPGNLGAIVRVAEAAGATGVVAAGTCADPFGWKTLRGSMGSALRVPIATADLVADAIADARAHGCRIVATAPRRGRSIFDADYAGPIALVIGAEGQGLAPDVLGAADERVTIPMQAPVESLNAAVTAALILYEARRQRGHETHDKTNATKPKRP